VTLTLEDKNMTAQVPSKYRNPSSLPIEVLRLNPENAFTQYGFMSVAEATTLVNAEAEDELLAELKDRFEALPEDDIYKSLILDIAANGVEQVVTAVPQGDTYYLAAGNKRLICATFANLLLDAGIKALPAKVLKLSADDVLKLQWRENNLRVAPTDADLALLFQKLLNKGWTPDDIVRDLQGTSKAQIKRLTQITVLEPQALDAVREGTVKVEAAIQAIKAAEQEDISTTEVSELIVEAAKNAIEEGKNKVSGAELTNAIKARSTKTPKEPDEVPDFKVMIERIKTFDWDKILEADLVAIANRLSKYQG
jgi:ParB-like chromosome segregation protein Spo0J